MQEVYLIMYQQALNFVCEFYQVTREAAELYYQDEIQSAMKLIEKGIIT